MLQIMTTISNRPGKFLSRRPTPDASEPHCDRHRHTRLQSHLEDRPDRPLPARYRLLQAADGAVDFSAPQRRQVVLRRHEPHHGIRLSEAIDIGELREQLDHVRTLKLSRGESPGCAAIVLWQAADVLAGFYHLAGGVPVSGLRAEAAMGSFELTFAGPWIETTFWEIPALASLPNCARGRC